MIWPPQDTGLFEYKTPCCACPLDFTLPDCFEGFNYFFNEAFQAPFGDPDDFTQFATLTDAEAFLAGFVAAGCLASYAGIIFETSPGNPDNPGGAFTLSATFASGQLTVDSVIEQPSGSFYSIQMAIDACLSLKAGDTVTVAFDSDYPSGEFFLLDLSTCGATFESFVEFSGPGTGSVSFPDAIPADGLYLFVASAAIGGSTHNEISFVVSATSGIVAVATPTIRYNDGSGGTGKLACS